MHFKILFYSNHIIIFILLIVFFCKYISNYKCMLEISILDIKSIKKKRKEKKRIEKKPQIGSFDKLFLLLNIYIQF